MMDMETLKMTAYWNNPRPAGVQDPSEVPYIETDKSSWWYLHGELTKITGYDKAIVTNVKSGGFSKDTIDWEEIDGNKVKSVNSETPIPVMCVTGVVPVKIDGIDRECLGYFWTDDVHKIRWKRKSWSYWTQRGVVVLKDNKEDVEYAERLFKERPKIF